LDYQVAAHLSDVLRIAAEWDLLLERSLCNRAFSSSKWFIGACRADSALSPHLLIARRAGSIVGVLPLALNRDERILQFPSGLCDYNDVVVARGDEDVAVGLLLYAMSGGHGYDRAMLEHIREDSNCAGAMAVIGNGREVTGSGLRERAFYIPLGLGYEEYVKARSPQLRKSLVKALRRASDNNISVQELRTASFAPADLPNLFLELHLKRFAGRTQFELPLRQSFVRDVFPAQFAEGRLKAFALFDRDKIIGIDLCMLGACSLCSWSGGFLPEAACWSPGALLTLAEIREAVAVGLAEYDFLRGSESYKQRWASHSRPVIGFELDLRAPEQPVASLPSRGDRAGLRHELGSVRFPDGF